MKQLQLWKRMRGVLILGVAVPTAVVVAGVVVIIAVIIWYAVDYNLSPGSVDLSGSTIIPQGQSGRYTASLSNSPSHQNYWAPQRKYWFWTMTHLATITLSRSS